MIFVTGDTHGDFRRFSTEIFPEQKEMTKDDFVIICGDFGGVWCQEDYIKGINNENYWLNWLDNKPFTTLFVDGNHENFTRLDSFSIKEWNGGKVHEIRPSVLHLMRGEIFNLQNKTFFTFGGASSHDISDGILDCQDPDWREKAKVLDCQGKFMYRIKGLSWWPKEMPNSTELQNGIQNLEKINYKVDFVITHTPPASIIAIMGAGTYKQDILTQYLEEIRTKLDYKNWFMGHMHDNRQFNTQDILLYEQIIRIA